MTDPYLHVHAALATLARQIWGEPVHVYVVTTWQDLPGGARGGPLELRITRGATWDAALYRIVAEDTRHTWSLMVPYRALLTRCLEDLDARANRTR